MTSVSEKINKCKICKEYFTNKQHLTRHIKNTHVTICEMKCITCNKKCTDISSLNKHIKEKHIKKKQTDYSNPKHSQISDNHEIELCFRKCFEVFDNIVYGNNKDKNLEKPSV